MDLVITFLCMLLSIVVMHSLQILKHRIKKLPPGPTPLPVIGNLHLVGKKPHMSLAQLAQTYGPVMSLKFGQVTTVVISSPSMARELLQKQDAAFANRTFGDALRALDHHKYGIAFLPPGSRWRSLRRVTISNIFSTSSLVKSQELRWKKVEELVDYCKKRCGDGEAVNIGRATFRTSLNLLSNTIFSRDLTNLFSEEDDGSAGDFQSLVTDIVLECGKPNLSDYFPAISRLDVQGTRGRVGVYFQKMIDLFKDLIDERIEKNEKSGDDEKSNDVLDALLDICKQSPEDFDRVHMEHLFIALFIAGTDTTSATVEWAMAQMLKNPHVLKRAKAELEAIIGRDKIVDETRIASLPYLQCVVKETLRLHPQAPLLIPRKVDQDQQLSGYTVPKGTQVFVNVWTIARDPSIWESPEEFKPERFLTSELDVKGRDFELLPFGAGRRICPGLPLAMRAMPLMLGSLLNCFDWKIGGGIKPEDLNMDDEFGFTLVKAQPLMAVPISQT